MLLDRTVTALIQEYLGMFPCVVLLGPRQSGKTTLLSNLLPSRQRYDLELRADFDQIATDPDLFLRSNTADLAIDEAQLLSSQRFETILKSQTVLFCGARFQLSKKTLSNES